MATAINIPDMGTTADRVNLARWIVKKGDSVERGDVLCEIETDKAVNELESVATGTVLDIVVPEGQDAEAGDTIAYIGDPGENIPDSPAESGADSGAGCSTGKQEVPKSRCAAETASVPPVIANLAKKLGVDTGAVRGTGPGGRITRADVKKAAESGGRKAPEKNCSDPESAGGLSRNRKQVAAQVSRSHREIPPAIFRAVLDMSRLLGHRESLSEDGKKPCVDALMLKAMSDTLVEFTAFRSKFEGDRLSVSDDINIAVAVANGPELYLPVVKKIPEKNVAEIDSEIRAFAKKAEKGSFVPEDLQGASVSLSNLGMFPALVSFTAIVPPGQAAILALGSAAEAPVVNEGKIAIARIAQAELSVDHRMINGFQAAEFLSILKKNVENMEG